MRLLSTITRALRSTQAQASTATKPSAQTQAKAQASALLLAAVLLLGSACERRPLEDPGYGAEIKIAVDINAICNVSCDVYNTKVPIPPIEKEVMRVLFYHPTEDRLITEAFVSEHGINDQGEEYIGGSISIVPGKYRIIIYAFGTESTIVADYDSFEHSKAYTDPLSESQMAKLKLKLKSWDDQSGKLLYQPDHLLVARSFEENIPYHAGTYTIHTEASSLVESYYLQVKVDGLEYVSSAQAILTGMSPSAQLASAQMDTDNPSAIYVPLFKSDDNGDPVICNVFNTFGRIPQSDNELYVTFDIHTVDGRAISRSFNISDLFLSQECIDHHWLLLEEHIVVDPPPPGPPSGGGGGFDPAVEDWDEEHRDITI